MSWAYGRCCGFCLTQECCEEPAARFDVVPFVLERMPASGAAEELAVLRAALVKCSRELAVEEAIRRGFQIEGFVIQAVRKGVTCWALVT